jgi:hypothetical protein
MDQLTTDILKVAIPAVLSSTAVTYYFQKRLKRIGSYEAVTQVLLQRMLDGAQAVLAPAQTVDRLALEILDLYKEELPKEERVRPLLTKIESTTAALMNSIYVHRMYITEFVPYGGSTHFNNRTTVITGYMELLLEGKLENEQTSEARSALLLAAERLRSDVHSVRESVERVRKNILAGKAP